MYQGTTEVVPCLAPKFRFAVYLFPSQWVKQMLAATAISVQICMVKTLAHGLLHQRARGRLAGPNLKLTGALIH